MSYYAVAKGRNAGVYNSWDDCKAQVHQYSGSDFKRFDSRAEAESFVESRSGSSSNSYSSSSRSSYSSYPSSSGGSSSYVSSRSHSDYTDVYVDGACASNGRDDARAGVGVFFDDDSPYNVSAPAKGRATSNNAEIRAVTEAAKQAQRAGIEKLRVNTDSAFLMKCKNEYMPKWKENGWRTSLGEPVKNKAELIEMEKALQPLDVKFRHVRGHTGVYGNEMADKLAREGSKRY